MLSGRSQWSSASGHPRPGHPRPGHLHPVQFNSRKKSFKEDQVCMFLGLFKETVVLFLARVSHLPCPASSPASEVIMSFSSSPHSSYLFLLTSAAASLPSLPFYDHLFTPALLAPGKDAGDKERLVWGLCWYQAHHQLPGLTCLSPTPALRTPVWPQ